MTIKEVLVSKRQRFSFNEPEVLVRYADSLLDPNDFDSLTDYGSRYAFIGMFQRRGQTQYYFADARRHAEMRFAIEKEIGPFDQYIYGQLHLGGDGKVAQLILHEDPGRNDSERTKHLSEFLNRVHPDYLRDEVLISWRGNIQLEYSTQNKRFEKLKRRSDW